MIVVDSSVWIGHFRNLATDKVLRLRQIGDISAILVGDLVLLEVLQGARTDADAAELERDLRQFEIVQMLDDKLAVQAAAHFRQLRQRGITVRKSIDVIIATFCTQNGHALLHDDRDFRPFATNFGLVCL